MELGITTAGVCVPCVVYCPVTSILDGTLATPAFKLAIIVAGVDAGAGNDEVSALTASAAEITFFAFDLFAEVFARLVTPEYETTVIAVKIPMTTITTKSSTIVKPFLLNLLFFRTIFIIPPYIDYVVCTVHPAAEVVEFPPVVDPDCM